MKKYILILLSLFIVVIGINAQESTRNKKICYYYVVVNGASIQDTLITPIEKFIQTRSGCVRHNTFIHNHFIAGMRAQNIPVSNIFVITEDKDFIRKQQKNLLPAVA